MRMHREQFGSRLSTRRRSLAVGALVLALSAAGPANANAVSGSGDGDIDSSATTSFTDETPPVLSVTTPGNRAQVLFDADAGDDIGFAITGSTFNSSVALELYDPRGAKVGINGTVTGAADDWEVSDLPLAGRYSLILKPGTGNSGSATVTLSERVSGPLDLTGPTALTTLSRVGQDGALTFSAQPGDSLSLGVDAAGMEKSLYARLYGPDGSQVLSRYVAAGGAGALDIDALPQAGPYTLTLDPDGAATGTVKVTGSHYTNAGILDPAAPAVELPIDRIGQDGRATFTATAGQRVSLGTAASGLGGYTRMEIRRPNGSRLDFFTVPDNSAAEWDSSVLPDSGTYTIAALPDNPLATGRLALTLSRPVALAPLSATGDPVAVSIGRFGQNAQAAFTADAGAQLTLAVTGNTFTETVGVSVFAPSGAAVVNGKTVAAGKSAAIELSESGLPESGAYTVILNPNKGSGGSLTLTLSEDLAVPLAADGPSAKAEPARPGQRVRIDFTAPDTASLGFAATGNSVPQPTDVRLIPEGGTSQAVGSFAKNADGVQYLAGLTPGKRYTLLLTPGSVATGSLTLWLSKPVAAGTLTAASPSVTSELTRPGQQLEYTTDVVAGGGAALVFSGTTLTAPSAVRHLPPGASSDVSLGSLRTADLDIALRAPLAAGTHRILVQPSTPATGRTTATLVPDTDAGAVTVGGAPKPVTISTPGGHGHLTFTGTKGQKITLGITAPASEWLLSVAGPDGKWLVNERSMSASTLSYALAALPANGVYTVTVDPGALKTGTYTLGLS
ncbi:hypothetical protein ACFXCZ_21805 [Streptomyces sp. NPDC059396]|uniref:hypothetical protein n=1 Tax=Streptomyces sp. NPDC059396 TaxID=3346819 RepID=UPI0036A2DEF1